MENGDQRRMALLRAAGIDFGGVALGSRNESIKNHTRQLTHSGYSRRVREHVCNCVLKEAEAAPAPVARLLWDCHEGDVLTWG